MVPSTSQLSLVLQIAAVLSVYLISKYLTNYFHFGFSNILKVNQITTYYTGHALQPAQVGASSNRINLHLQPIIPEALNFCENHLQQTRFKKDQRLIFFELSQTSASSLSVSSINSFTSPR